MTLNEAAAFFATLAKLDDLSRRGLMQRNEESMRAAREAAEHAARTALDAARPLIETLDICDRHCFQHDEIEQARLLLRSYASAGGTASFEAYRRQVQDLADQAERSLHRIAGDDVPGARE